MKHLNEVPGIPADLEQRILFLMGAQDVKRYHVRPMLRENTIAAHSWSVAWLCHMIAENPTVNLIMAALSHDMAEKIYGDVPRPAAVFFGKPLLAACESNCLNDFQCLFELDDHEKDILSIADNFDGMLFCCAERRMGNRSVEAIFENYNSYVELLPRYPNGTANDIHIAILSVWRDAIA